jgi:hypothetical protein
MIARYRCKGRLDRVGGAGIETKDLNSQCRPRFTRLLQSGFGSGGIVRIDQHGNASGLGQQLVQKGKSLRDDLMDEKINAGHVTIRPCEARNQTELDWVDPDPEHDRDRRGRSLGGESTGREAWRRDQGHATADEVCQQRRQAVVLTLHPVVFDPDVASLNVARFAQALAKRGGIAQRGIGRRAVEECDHGQHRLLCTRRDRPRNHPTTYDTEKIAPSHAAPRVQGQVSYRLKRAL